MELWFVVDDGDAVVGGDTVVEGDAVVDGDVVVVVVVVQVRDEQFKSQIVIALPCKAPHINVDGQQKLVLTAIKFGGEEHIIPPWHP